MALITFPSGTNQQLFVEYLNSTNILDYEDRDSDIWVKDMVLYSEQSVIDYLFSLGGYITGKTGFG